MLLYNFFNLSTTKDELSRHVKIWPLNRVGLSLHNILSFKN